LKLHLQVRIGLPQQLKKALLLSVEFLDELEKKVALLVQSYQKLCEENAVLKRESGKKTGGASEIEKENRTLRKEIGACRENLQKHHEKLRAAGERIRDVIAKIETA
jgi:FtsZ-binding cell division protein ZapB